LSSHAAGTEDIRNANIILSKEPNVGDYLNLDVYGSIISKYK
jgi:hypothetical protein